MSFHGLVVRAMKYRSGDIGFYFPSFQVKIELIRHYCINKKSITDAETVILLKSFIFLVQLIIIIISR